MVLSLRAVQRLSLLGNGENGIRLRDGIERLFDHAHGLERALFALVVEQQSTQVPTVELSIEALRTIQALCAAGRKRIPRWVQDMARGIAPAPVRIQSTPAPQIAGPVVQPPPPNVVTIQGVSITPQPAVFPPEFTVRYLKHVAGPLGVKGSVARRRLQQAGLWDDREWHLVGMEQLIRPGGGFQSQDVHAFRDGIVSELIRRESGPMFRAARP